MKFYIGDNSSDISPVNYCHIRSFSVLPENMYITMQYDDSSVKETMANVLL